MNEAENETDALARRVRTYLCDATLHARPVTYLSLAKSLDLSPPNTIHQVTCALEQLIAQDAKNGQPLIAALVISKARGGLPAQGFFDCAQRVGRFDVDPSGPDAAAFHAAEFNKAMAFWVRPMPK